MLPFTNNPDYSSSSSLLSIPLYEHSIRLDCKADSTSSSSPSVRRFDVQSSECFSRLCTLYPASTYKIFSLWVSPSFAVANQSLIGRIINTPTALGASNCWIEKVVIWWQEGRTSHRISCITVQWKLNDFTKRVKIGKFIRVLLVNCVYKRIKEYKMQTYIYEICKVRYSL